MTEQCQSLPYGDGLDCTGTGSNHLHYTGKERDTESQNDYFGGRYYASNLAGRWLTPDWSSKVEPVPYARLNDPQSLNLYAYVGDNPLSTVDPDGHSGQDCANSNNHPAQECSSDKGTSDKPEAQQQDTVTVEHVQGHDGNPAGHAVISVDGKTAVGLDQRKASAADALEGKTTPGAVVPVDPSRKVEGTGRWPTQAYFAGCPIQAVRWLEWGSDRGRFRRGRRTNVYDQSGRAVETYSETQGAPLREEVYAGGLHVATYGTTTTYCDDDEWTGSERVRSNVEGKAIESWANLPYGDDQVCQGGDVSQLHFTGKQRDPETTNDYFGARYYASNIAGRFLTPDPSGLSYADPNDPQSLNLYAYVRNNPLIFTDPTGMDCVFASDAGKGIVDGNSDANSNSGACLQKGGTFVDGTVVPHSFAHDSNGDLTFSFTNSTTGAAGSAVIGLPGGQNLVYNQQVAAAAQYFALHQSLLAPTSAPNNGTPKQPDGRTLPSCLSLGMQTAANDLNPFNPSAFDFAKGAATAGSMMTFNQALSYAAIKGLTYPNKSSVFSGLMSESGILTAAADAMPLFAVDYAAIDAIHTELTAQCSYP